MFSRPPTLFYSITSDKWTEIIRIAAQDLKLAFIQYNHFLGEKNSVSPEVFYRQLEQNRDALTPRLKSSL